MSGERCPTCHRPVWDGGHALNERECSKEDGEVCILHARCLAAERDRDEAVARAERAEAVAQAADLYASEPEGSEHIPAHYDDLLAALDEWRRTRQSKEQTP